MTTGLCSLERFVIWNKQTKPEKGAGDTLLLGWHRFEVVSLGGELNMGISQCLSTLLFPIVRQDAYYRIST
jgi:hypothetical protein